MIKQSGIAISDKFLVNFILCLFVSSALVFLEFSLFSVSFLFGSVIVFSVVLQRQNVLKINGFLYVLLFFVFAIFLSLLFSELPLGSTHFRISFQVIYWLLLSVIVFNMYDRIPKKTLSKGVFFTVLLLMILYVSGFSVGTQNSIAFTAIIFSPLGFYYLKSFTFKLIFSLVIVYLLLQNGSRSGAIISIIQAILVLFSAVPRLRRYIKTLIIGAFLFSFLAFSDELMESIGGAIYPYNEELGELLINTNYVLNNDLSWLQRKAQVQKAKQIFEEHPILGVGFSNFPSYDVRIDELAVGGDITLKGIENRSAHNSYYEVLAETGLIGFILFCVFFIGALISFWRNLNLIVSEFEVCIFVSLIGMLIYFYSISAYLGTSSWIMYSLYAAGSYKARNIKSLI